jgi:hypothetical protein
MCREIKKSCCVGWLCCEKGNNEGDVAFRFRCGCCVAVLGGGRLLLRAAFYARARAGARARAHNLHYAARASAQVKHHAVHESPAGQHASRAGHHQRAPGAPRGVDLDGIVSLMRRVCMN